jgi:hypothetical protein
VNIAIIILSGLGFMVLFIGVIMPKILIPIEEKLNYPVVEEE